jgi:TusA-related sulfurtransferase
VTSELEGPGDSLDVTLLEERAHAADDAFCMLRDAAARLPPGGRLTVRAGDPKTRERLRAWCQRHGYLLADAEDGSSLVGKVGVDARSGADEYGWSVRALGDHGGVTRVHTGKHSLSIGPAVSFRPDEPLPTAVQHLLAALAADVVSGVATCARARGIEADAIECRITGHLDDPLASIGVVGASGTPALRTVSGTVYVSSDADQATLREVWCETLRRSPLFNTLAPRVALRLELRPEP